MRNTITGARVYRFHDAVAINFKVEGRFTETFYIPEALAHHLAALVQSAAEDITLKDFGSSEVGTWNAKVVEDPQLAHLATIKLTKE